MNDFNKIIYNYEECSPCLVELQNNTKNLKNPSHNFIFSYLIGYFSQMKININDFKAIFEEYKNDAFEDSNFSSDFKRITFIFCKYFQNKNNNKNINLNFDISNSNNINNSNNNFISNNNNFSNSNLNNQNINFSKSNINNQNINFSRSNINNQNINFSKSNINNQNVNFSRSNINSQNFNNIGNSIYNRNINYSISDNNNNQSQRFFNSNVNNNIFNQSNSFNNNKEMNILNDYELAKQIEEEEKVLLQLRQEKDASNQSKKCEICLEDFSLLDCTNYFLNCNCVLHNKCFDEMVKIAVENNTLPVKCPNCGMPVHPNFIEDSLRNSNPQLFPKYEKFSMNNFLQNNSDEYSSCPTPGCEYMFFFNPGEINFLCPLCNKNYCLNCKDEWHRGLTCQQYRDSRDVNKLDDQFFKFVKGAKFKMCPTCKYWVEKNQGCNHMKCRCGADFCYLCGKLMDMRRSHKC